MSGIAQAFSGFFLVGVMILVGYLTTKLGVAAPGNERILSRICYFVLGPCLLFSVVSDANVQLLLSSLLVVSACAAGICFVAYAAIAWFFLKRRGATLVIGSLSSGFANAGTLGIPVATYFLGSAAYVVPIILLQAVVFTPLTLATLDAVTASERRALLPRVIRMALNPILIATALGIMFALTGWSLPAFAMDPIRLLGEASVPLVLIAFGMSFVGTRVLGSSADRLDTLTASGLKLILMPTAAWLIGKFALNLEGHDLFAVTLLAALPTAGNVFTFAQRYCRGELIARDAGLLTTLGSLPALLLITVLLVP